MKCAKCGAELKVGCIYCSVCGKEAQIVSDSSLMEEELLRELLNEKEKTPEKKGRAKKPKRNHKPLIISLSCLGVLLVAVLLAIAVISHKNDNSYEYQMKKAGKYVSEMNYSKALKYYGRALELNENDITARLKMVEVCILMEEEKSAISLLHEVIELDASNEDACRLLIELYNKEQDYDAILKLKDELKDEKLLKLFEEYTVLPPEFSLKPGTYPEYITVELTAEEGCKIYYSLNGSDITKDGLLYEEPLELKEQGSMKIYAVACNKYGIYSDVVIGNYTVKFQKPQMAKAIPDSGSFTEAVLVELVGSEGCRMFYTWDGSNPTMNSEEYTGPITVPEGNNILSVILVDKYGMISDVMKCNYIYIPRNREMIDNEELPSDTE